MPSFDFNLVGASFRSKEVKHTIKHLSKGARLTLEREPTNAYDPFAVKVLFEDEFLGYVPKSTAPDVSVWLLDNPEGDVSAFVSETYLDDEGADPLKPRIHVDLG